MTNPVDPRRTARRQPPRQRQTATIVAIAVAVVAGALLVVVLSQKDSGKGAASPPLVASTTTTATSGGPAIDRQIPDGDYGPFCAEARREVPAPVAGNPTPQQISAIYEQLDFAKLIPVAPPGLKQPLATLQATRGDIARLIAQVHSLADIQPADLPAGFTQAFTTLTLAYDARCHPSAGTPSTTGTSPTTTGTSPTTTR